ncbi:MAG: hypothetical protein AAF772_19920 [Acidobacteriota bacterium]
MASKAKPLVGLILLLAVAGAAVYLVQGGGSDLQREAPAEPITVTGYHGGEKSGFLRNPDVQALLDDVGLTVKSRKAGSIEMVRTLPLDGQDCVWPSNRVAADLYRQTQAAPRAVENIFRSPLVLYAWDEVADALIDQGIVSQRDSTFYVVDFPKLIALVLDGTPWQDVGLPSLYGAVKVVSTDPARSNSGNMFFALLATMINEGQVVGDDASLARVLPEVVRYREAMGHMESSSGDLFESFLNMGMGARPIIAGYENQLIEYAMANPEHRDLLRQRIRTLYPVPTLWADHPLIARTAACQRLIEALEDPEIQRLAWTQHGFRSGLAGGADADPSVLEVVGIPPRIDAVVPMPSATIMERMVAAFEP